MSLRDGPTYALLESDPLRDRFTLLTVAVDDEPEKTWLHRKGGLRDAYARGRLGRGRGRLGRRGVVVDRPGRGNDSWGRGLRAGH